MKLKKMTAAAMILAALPTLALAQDRPAHPPMPVLDFATADANSDGAISREEWTAYTATLAGQMREQAIALRADALIQSGDANADGALARDELIAALTAQADERRESREGRGGWMRGHGGPEGMMRGQGGHEGMMRGQGGHEGMMRGQGGHEGMMRGQGGHEGMMGGQGGRRGEMRGDGPMGGDRGFSRLDENRDGSLSPDELAQAQAFLTWMAQRPGRN